MADSAEGRSHQYLSVSIAPAIAVVAYVVVEALDDGHSLLAAVPSDVRLALFAALAGTTGALLGFAIAGVTIIVTLTGGRRVAWLNRNPKYRKQVQMLFGSATIALALATLIFLMLIVFGSDSGSIPTLWGALGAGALILVIDRMAHLVKFLNKLMPIAMQDNEEQVGDKPYRGPNPPFTDPGN